MGQFRFEMTAVGGHGCERQVKDGGKVYGCGSMSCPDCAIAEFVAQFARRTGAMIEVAKLVHWPGQTGEVKDEFDLTVQPLHSVSRVPRTRRGNF